jgi:hypothetical protein
MAMWRTHKRLQLPVCRNGGIWTMLYVLQDGMNIGVPFGVSNYPSSLNLLRLAAEISLAATMATGRHRLCGDFYHQR